MGEIDDELNGVSEADYDEVSKVGEADEVSEVGPLVEQADE